MLTREGERFSVLLVKSNLDDFHFFKKGLEGNPSFPLSLDLVSNLQQALAKLKRPVYHMVLVESEVEDEDPNFLQTLKKKHLKVPFVLLLPVKDDRLTREAMRCGIADVIIKNESHFQELAGRLRESYEIFQKNHKKISRRNSGAFNFSEKAKIISEEPLIRDELTGLYNHGYLYERVVRETSRAVRYNYPISSIMLDIDTFRTINEEHGYFAGEKLLKEAADLFFENCRMSDFVARYSGEEFCMVLPHSGYEGVKELAERLKTLIENHTFLPETHRIKITVSMGIASYPQDTMTQRGDLIRLAGEALLHSKSLGRSRITLFRDVIPDVNEDIPALMLSEEKITQFQRRMTEINNNFQRSYMEASRALISALEGKDKHTVGHSASTAKYCFWVAQTMGLGRDEAEAVRQGGLLHDIGKICIPDTILLKPARLTLEEYETMKQHSYLGYKIIKPIKFLQEESLFVLHHHEWVNGEGYPCKLKGEEIPLGARIISVVDSYDTIRMAGGRYKKTSNVEDAVNELIACSNKQFDVKVVKAFIEVLISRGELQPGSYQSDRLEEALKAAPPPVIPAKQPQ